VVESGGLENRCAGNRTEGSNPSPSARKAASPPSRLQLGHGRDADQITGVERVRRYRHGQLGVEHPGAGRVTEAARVTRTALRGSTD
jgi:hypothetical protein